MDMAQDPRNSIDSVQLMFLLHTVPIGIGILGMVRFVASKSGHDACLSILMSGLYPQLAIVFMWLLLKRFRKLGVYQIHQRLFGKWIGGMLNLLLSGYFLFNFFLVLRTYVELVVTWMFQMSPVWLLTGLFLVPIVYVSLPGLRLLGRFSIMTFFLTIWLLVLTYYPFSEGTVSHLLPVGSSGIGKIFQGSLMSALSLLGTEVLLVVYPYVIHKNDVLKAASIASWAVIAVYVINGLATLTFFSFGQLQKTIWPMLTMFKHVQVPFVERFETFTVALWLIHIVCTCGTMLWAGLEGIEKTVSLRRGFVCIAVVIATLICSTLLEGRTEINRLLDMVAKYGLYFMVGYPLLLWLTALVMRKKGEGA